ncbi:MAG TPA: hypothetical protein VGV38_15720 [Pyrinomonadaceae bacterium]|nr:hypothetical protein [Pyrinomonadaceae bacterium]
MPPSKRVAALFLAAVAAFSAASCSGQPRMRLDEISAPQQQARMGVDEGAYEVHIDRVTAEVRRLLEEKYGDSEVMLYTLAPDADWNSIVNFYEPRLGAKGLKRDASVPAERLTYKLAVWADAGFLSRRAAAAAFIEAGRAQDGTPLKFLAVFSTD